MWRRRGPEPDAPENEEDPQTPPLPSAPPPPIPAPAPPINDDPYAQLEHFFEQPIVLQDAGPQTRSAAPPPPPEPRAPATAVSEPQAASLSETIERLEEFAKRLATRFEALEGKVEGGSAQTLEALRRLGERMGAELAMLDKRTVNLELTMARLRSTTEALDSSLRRLPDYRPPEPAPAAETPMVADETSAADTEPAAEMPAAEPAAEAPAVADTPVVADSPPPDEASPPPGALFTLEEEVPPPDWDEPPPEDTPPPDPTSP